ncbi:MAG: AAA family ATPase [Alphaproteobacteria bacterium]|nr:AAA family ATPase [Alphaproteobacteria bacterium]
MVSIALIMQKGGSGKTTAATNIAAVAMANLLKVVLVDLDPQGSASTWHAVRQSVCDGADDIVLEVANMATLQRVLSKHKDAVVVIDTPPHNSSLTATVLDLVDMALVPVRPSAFDLAAVSDTADVIRRSKCGVVGAVLNGAIPQSTVGAEIGQALADAGLPVVGQMHQRMAFQHAAAAGLGVVEYESRGKAAEEVNTLWDAIAAQLQVGEPV